MKLNTSLIIRFIRFFDTIKLMEIAINTGFLTRKRSLLPDTIIKVFTFGLLNIPNPSLQQIAAKCEEIQPGLSITKNAIFKRLPAAAKFLQQCFLHSIELSLKQTVPVKKAPILSQFKDVKICDSTRISLPDKLANVFPGLGGRNAKASLKIQTIFSLVTSSFTKFELTPSPGPDTTYNEQLLEHMQKDELLIVDLGYFCKDFFFQLQQKESYYLSRLRKNTVVYIEKGNQLVQTEFTELLQGESIVDRQIVIGAKSKQQLKCRLIAVRLPNKVADERRRKANQKAKNQGKQLTDKERNLLAWNIIITNVTQDMLSAEAACDLYRARWQLELVFKACKNHLNIDKVGQCGQYQLECLIYGRLIAAVFISILYNGFSMSAYKAYQKGISILLFAKLITNHNTSILKNLCLALSAINQLKTVFIKIIKNSLQGKRKRKTTFQILCEYFVPKNNYQNTA